MRAFVDTSAFYAMLFADDHKHTSASKLWQELITRRAALITTNYVLTAAVALLQRRLGLNAVRAMQVLLADIHVIWVDQSLHERAFQQLLAANRRNLRLVDCVSFAAMREQHINIAFAFDEHFAEQGFQVLG